MNFEWDLSISMGTWKKEGKEVGNCRELITMGVASKKPESFYNFVDLPMIDGKVAKCDTGDLKKWFSLQRLIFHVSFAWHDLSSHRKEDYLQS